MLGIMCGAGGPTREQQSVQRLFDALCRRSTDSPLRSETLPIKADRISKVTTVDIQTGNRQVSEREGGPDLAPPTPPRAQGTVVPLRRTEQRRLAARQAAATLAEGAALGLPSSTERPYFKVRICPTISFSCCALYQYHA